MKWLGEENTIDRTGIVTAGPFAAILTNADGERAHAVDTIARERLGLETPPPTSNGAIERGRRLEGSRLRQCRYLIQRRTTK